MGHLGSAVRGFGDHWPLRAGRDLGAAASDPFSVQTQGRPLLGTAWSAGTWQRRGNKPSSLQQLALGEKFQRDERRPAKKTSASGLATGKTLFVQLEREFLVRTERTNAASVYLGKQTFPLHPDPRTALRGSWQHRRAHSGGARRGEAPSSPVNHGSLAAKQQAQDGGEQCDSSRLPLPLKAGIPSKPGSLRGHPRTGHGAGTGGTEVPNPQAVRETGSAQGTPLVPSCRAPG